jgi:hypothetical protein
VTTRATPEKRFKPEPVFFEESYERDDRLVAPTEGFPVKRIFDASKGCRTVFGRDVRVEGSR